MNIIGNLSLKLHFGIDNLKNKIKNNVKEFYSDERGVSPVVATVLILLMVVILAAVFWDNIVSLFNDLWDIISGDARGIDGGNLTHDS